MEEEYELQINVNEICRACLIQSPADLKNIFCHDIVDGKIVSFPKIFECCMDFKVIKEDGLPQNICTSCKVKLKDFYHFKEKAQQSRDLLHQIYKIPLNSETASPVKTNDESSQTDMLVVDIETQTNEDIDDSVVEIEMEKLDDIVVPHDEEEELGIESIQTDAEYMHEEVDNEPIDVDNIDTVTIIKEEEYEPKDDEVIFFEYQRMINEDYESENAEVVREDEEDEEEQPFIEYELNDEDVEPIEPIETSIIEQAPITKDTEKYDCTYCKTVVKGSDKCKLHVDVHKKTIDVVFDAINYFRCGACLMVFVAFENLKSHFDTLDACSKTENEEVVHLSSSVAFDIALHQDFDKIRSEIIFPKIYTFRQSGDTIQCGKCVTFEHDTFENLAQHYSEAHEISGNFDELWVDYRYNKPHICGICQFVFPDAKYIRQHMYFHNKIFYCPYDCGNQYVSFAKMHKHFVQKHFDDQVHTCERCGAKYSSFDSLRHHWKVTCPGRSRSCFACNKKFSSNNTLRLHERIHTKEKRYGCTICDKKFIQRSDLTMHFRTHTGERPYKCTLCDKRFRTTGHRSDHMTTHTNEKNYECRLCSKKFKSERILQGHMSLHSGFKPFQCEICQRRFSRRQHLRLHGKTHVTKNVYLEDDSRDNFQE